MDNFEKIYKDNYTKVFAFILSITNDFSLSEDIVQEAFLKAYKNLHNFRYESKINVWINKIAYNLLIDNKRKKSSKELLPEDEALLRNIIDLDKNLQKELEQKIMSECVQNKLLILSENYRAPLYLDLNGYSNQEIADILNCSLENAKIRLYRGKKKIKEILENQCSLYQDERNVLC